MQLPNEPGLWAHCPWISPPANRPALFLDRDGVVVEEVHFLRRIEDVRLTPGIAAAIAAANRAGVPVVVVTNQSGIARGHFGWGDFAAVQDEIAARLAVEGAVLDAVLACGYHAGGTPPYDHADHAWRKPGPGMLLEAAARLGIALAASTMVGDRLSDLEAARAAGLSHGFLVMTGYGRDHADELAHRRRAWNEAGFQAAIVETPAMAVWATLDAQRVL